MSAEPKKTLSRIRTFATDFARDQKESGQPLPPGITAPEPVTPQARLAESGAAADIAKIIDKSPSVVVEAHVPAFHELKKNTPPQVVAIAKGTTTPRPPLPEPARAEGVKTVVVRNTKPSTPAAGATIITDNKRAEQKLFPALFEAIRGWFKALAAKSKQKSVPTYTVTDTERRKGVIQKATTKTGTIFTADNETLKDEIRRRSWEQPPKESSAPEISWSLNTEVGYPLLDSGPHKQANVTVEFKKYTEQAPAALERTKTPEPVPMTPPPVFVEPTEPVPLLVEQPEPISVVPAIQPAPVFVQSTLPPIVSSPAQPQPVQAEAPYALTTPEAHYRIKSIGDVTKLNTNILSIGVVGVIAGLIIVLIVGQSLVNLIFENTAQSTTVAATPLGNGGAVRDVILSTLTSEAVIIALQQIPTDAQTQQEFRLTDTLGVPLQKQIVLPLLGFSNTGSLSQSIDTMHLLQIGANRGIIFTVFDATTAFGSLLAWEGSMVKALGPILNTSQPTELVVVSDRTIQNTDIRIFTANNQEILVYGFIDGNTVLITKDVPTFTAALVSQ